MRLDGPSFHRILGAAALIAPVLAVQLTQRIADWGPSPARASERPPEPDGPLAAGAGEKPLTAAQQRAEAFLRAERANPAASDRELSPMYEAPRVNDEPRPAPTPELPKAPASAPRLILTGIMAGQTRRLASINNRIVTVGDEVAPGWKISEIDVAERTVSVVNGSGRALKLTPPAQKSR